MHSRGSKEFDPVRDFKWRSGRSSVKKRIGLKRKLWCLRKVKHPSISMPLLGFLFGDVRRFLHTHIHTCNSCFKVLNKFQRVIQSWHFSLSNLTPYNDNTKKKNKQITYSKFKIQLINIYLISPLFHFSRDYIIILMYLRIVKQSYISIRLIYLIST